MQVIHTPFLEIDSALQEEIVLESGLKLFIDGTWNPEEHATVIGRVAALPKFPKGEESTVLSQLMLGDEIAFNYGVCADTDFNDDSENFQETTEGSDYLKSFRNSKGDQIKVVALPGKISPIWVGVLNDKHGELVDGCQGGESVVNRWLAQFEFGGSDQLKFKNLFDLNGDHFWRANYRDLFCVRRNGEIVALGDWIVCDPIFLDRTDAYNLENGIALPPMSVAFMLTDRAIVVSGGEDFGFEKDDIIAAPEQFWNKYKLFGREYFIVKKRNVTGRYE